MVKASSFCARLPENEDIPIVDKAVDLACNKESLSTIKG